MSPRPFALFGLVVIAACGSSSGGSSGAPSTSCVQAGAFVMTLVAGVGSLGGSTATSSTCSCQPDSMSVTVQWGDGSATINGQNCEASADPSTCEVDVLCCEILPNDGGPPQCDTTNSNAVANAQFLATTPAPTDVRVLPASATALNTTACECAYCDSNYPPPCQ